MPPLVNAPPPDGKPTNSATQRSACASTRFAAAGLGRQVDVVAGGEGIREHADLEAGRADEREVARPGARGSRRGCARLRRGRDGRRPVLGQRPGEGGRAGRIDRRLARAVAVEARPRLLDQPGRVTQHLRARRVEPERGLLVGRRSWPGNLLRGAPGRRFDGTTRARPTFKHAQVNRRARFFRHRYSIVCSEAPPHTRAPACAALPSRSARPCGCRRSESVVRVSVVVPFTAPRSRSNSSRRGGLVVCRSAPRHHARAAAS